MNWDDLRLVDAAARTLSLSAAARTLGLSQPQLSRRLRSFEDRIGARLFDRTPRGLRPTAAGARLIPLAADMRGAADAVRRAQPDLASAALNTVRLSVDEVRERLVLERLPDVLARAPGVTLEIVCAHLHADHMQRETEIQLRSCLPETDSLIARRVGGVAYALYGAASATARAVRRGVASRSTLDRLCAGSALVSGANAVDGGAFRSTAGAVGQHHDGRADGGGGGRRLGARAGVHGR